MPDTTTVFDAADDYERFMGRWSRAIGEKFLDWLGAPVNARWLDVGCGTGAFSELIGKRCTPDDRGLDVARRLFVIPADILAGETSLNLLAQFKVALVQLPDDVVHDEDAAECVERDIGFDRRHVEAAQVR